MNNKTIIHTCPNGFTVLIYPKAGSELVSVRYSVKTGSIYEGRFLGSGISHLLEHMVFKGTEEYTCEQLATEVKRYAGDWNAFTNYDHTAFFIDGVAKNWKEYVHILAQLTLHPTFPKEDFEREREVIRREIAMYNDNPDSVMWNNVFANVFSVSPFKYPIIGHLKRFNRLTYDDMLAYHKERYVPSNMFAVVVGGVDPEEVKRKFDEEMANVPAACVALPASLVVVVLALPAVCLVFSFKRYTLLL